MFEIVQDRAKPFLLLGACFLATAATGDAQQSSWEDALQFMQQSHSLAEWKAHVATVRYDPAVSERLLGTAARMSFGAQQSDRMTNGIRMLVFGTLLDLRARNAVDRWPANEDLTTLGPKALTVLEEEGIVSPEEPVRRFLLRRPALTQEGSGFYVSVRSDDHAKGKVRIIERSDRRLNDLGPEWSRSEIQTTPQPGRPVEHLTYVLPLANARNYVAAAKSLLCASLLEAGSRKAAYARISAGNFLYYLSENEGTESLSNAALTAWVPLNSALETLTLDPGSMQLTALLKSRLTETRFSTRHFADALKDYREAASTPEFRATAEWYMAICSLALEDRPNAVAHFRSAAEASAGGGDREANIRYGLRAAVHVFGSRNVFGADSAAYEGRVNSGGDFSGQLRFDANMRLSRVFHTAGQDAASARLLMREIARARQADEARARENELIYLRDLGATAQSLFSHVSWKLGVDGKEGPRAEGALKWSRSIVPTVSDAVNGGCMETGKYGGCSAGEDIATVVDLYIAGVPKEFDRDFPGFSAIRAYLNALGETPSPGPQVSKRPGEELAQWVRRELSTIPADGRPLLKLVFVEWFYVPLQGLPQTSTLGAWKYRPVNSSGMTQPTDVDLVLGTLNMSQGLREVWAVYREMRDFLARTYP